MTKAEQKAAATFERIIRIIPAFDKRHPDPSKNYGIGSVHLLFVLKGAKGAVNFSCSTGMYLPHVMEEHKRKGWDIEPMGFGVWYCSPFPAYEGQTPREKCEWLDGKPCYGDGSCLASDDVMPRLLQEGDEGVWKKLEEFYNSWLS